MNITHRVNEPKVKIETLSNGTVFKYCDEYYMYIGDHFSDGDPINSDESATYAVRIEDGLLHEFGINTIVNTVEAEIIIG
jgi:hypothetical protein